MNPSTPERGVESPSRRAAVGAGLAFAALPFGFAGCGGAAVAVIPFITFSFEGILRDAGGNLQRVQLNLNTTATSSAGTFNNPTINSRRLADGGDAQNLSARGSFSGTDLRLEVVGAQAPLAAAYDGSFVAPDTIELRPTAGNTPILTLRRDERAFDPELNGSTWGGQDAGGRRWVVAFQVPPQGGSNDVTMLLSGTEQLGDPPVTSVIEGYVNVHVIEITARRASGAATFTGRLGPPGIEPPSLTPPDPRVRATTLEIDGGGRLTRNP